MEQLQTAVPAGDEPIVPPQPSEEENQQEKGVTEGESRVVPVSVPESIRATTSEQARTNEDEQHPEVLPPMEVRMEEVTNVAVSNPAENIGAPAVSEGEHGDGLPTTGASGPGSEVPPQGSGQGVGVNFPEGQEGPTKAEAERGAGGLVSGEEFHASTIASVVAPLTQSGGVSGMMSQPSRLKVVPVSHHAGVAPTMTSGLPQGRGQEEMHFLTPPQTQPHYSYGATEVPMRPPGMPQTQPSAPMQWDEVQPDRGGSLEGGAQQRHLRVQDALAYLDLVKLKFSQQQHIYTQFLEVMKEFKAQTIDTSGVIRRVSTLFQGHKDLILGFNTFLPGDKKIEDREAEALAQGLVPATVAGSSTLPPPPQPMPAMPAMGVEAQAMSMPGADLVAVAGGGAGQSPFGVGGGQSVPGGQGGGVAPAQSQEFDHAIHYVTKIKTRFHNQPEIYKAFLDVLHTYQKEQRTIKEVFDQVANLFHGHPDLLAEFTQFLPQPTPQPQTQQADATTPARPRGAKSRRQQRSVLGKESRVTKRRMKDGASERFRSGIGQDRLKHYKGARSQAAFPGTPKELAFFERVRQRLNNAEMYEEFLKCLNLFSMEILSKNEFVLLMQDLLGNHPDLFQAFKRFIGFDEEEFRSFERARRERETQVQRAQHAPLHDLDWSSLKRYGPSYRALPREYPVPRASGRTALCNEVLNDTYVSVATGEEGGFAFVRHNQYAETLFRCEDDRYELDMVVEANVSTIRRLEPVAEQIVKLTAEERQHFRLSDDHLLGVVHRRAIERIYGENAPQIIDGIHRNMVVAIPIVLQRLLEKDDEWKKARLDWAKVWREVSDRNYRRSLDHQALSFKNNDKKLFNTKAVVAEIKKIHDEKREEMEQAKVTAGRKGERLRAELARRPKHHMAFKLADVAAFRDVTELVFFAAQHLGGVTISDRENIAGFWQDFVDVCLGFGEAKEGVDGETRGSESEEKYKHFRPLVVDKMSGETNVAGSLCRHEALPAERRSALGSTEQSQEPQILCIDPDEPTVALYVPSSVFAFLRMLQILHERLSLARELVKNYRPPSPKRDPVTIPRPEPGAQESHPYPGDPEHAEMERRRKEVEEEGKRDPYDRFTRLLKAALRQEIDATKFEDDMRDLLGYKAFVFFTADRVISAVVKQMTAIFQDQCATQLLKLFEYERSRRHPDAKDGRKGPGPINTTDETTYLSNAVALVGEEQLLFRVERGLHSGVLTYRVLELTAAAPPLRTVDEHWAAYVQSYINSEPAGFGLGAHRGRIARPSRVFELSKEESSALLTDVVVCNGLECMISPHTYCMRYVQDTYDFFFRPPAARAWRKAALRRLPHRDHGVVCDCGWIDGLQHH